MKTLRITNLPEGTTERDLTELFWELGVLDASVHEDRWRWYGLVTFADDEKADMAAAVVVTWRGRRLGVDVAMPDVQQKIVNKIEARLWRTLYR